MNGESLLKEKDKKIKKIPIKKIKKLLWIECRRVADSLYVGQNGTYTCFICKRPISGSNKQLSHLIPKSVCGTFLKYDVHRNLKWCCYNCNINLGGNLAEYYREMLKTHTQEFMEELYADKKRTVKENEFLPALLEKYKLL